jgi:hypothetical protein
MPAQTTLQPPAIARPPAADDSYTPAFRGEWFTIRIKPDLATGELLADDSVTTVTVNLDGVEYLSKSFADESIGVLVRFYGYDTLIRKLRLVGGNRDVQKSIAEAIYIRQQEALAETV